MRGSVSVVSGGASGIGLAICLKLLAEGSKVYSLDLNVCPDSEITSLQCDVSDRSAVLTAIQTVLAESITIDFVVANAGAYVTANLEDTTEEDFARVVGSNLAGTFWLLQATLPTLRTAKRGAVVVMASDQALIGKAKSAIYGATKGAVAQLTKSTAIEYAPYGVRVNGVCPGAIETPLCEAAIRDYIEIYSPGIHVGVQKAAVAQKHPLGRTGKPEEVADLVQYLLSERAGFITGSLFSIDGGYTAQ